jgi:hypothetical protein
MTKTLARFAAALLMTSCGGKTLDVGGGSNTDADSGGTRGVDGGNVGGGTMSTVLVPNQQMANSLYVHNAYLYWNVGGPDGGEVRRCRPQSCLETLETVWRPASGILFRGENMYFWNREGFVSCPVSGCVSPTLLLPPPMGGPAVVDDTRIYWSQLFESAVYSCPISGCAKPEKAILTGVMTGFMHSDETHLYWISPDSAAPRVYVIQSAPKDGSEKPKTMTRASSPPASLRVHGGFVYWSTMAPKGQIARCATSACPDTGPEMLVSDEHYPQHPAVRGDALFWLAETTANPGDKVERPVYVKSCALSDCASTVTVLDRAMGGSSIPPRVVVAQQPALAVDDEAIYYIGDVTAVPAPGATAVVDSSIRRLPRKAAAP